MRHLLTPTMFETVDSAKNPRMQGKRAGDEMEKAFFNVSVVVAGGHLLCSQRSTAHLHRKGSPWPVVGVS